MSEPEALDVLVPAGEQVRFRPSSQMELAPSTSRERLRANVAVLELLADLEAENRLPSGAEQGVLARWSGWGSLPEVFDDTVRHSDDAQRARDLLEGRVRAAAARTTLNAHYTDAALVQAVWTALGEAGFDRNAGGRVLEPGCGSGTFIGFAPEHVRDVIGVELDPTTARVAALLYPGAEVREESFAETRLPAASRDLVIGNVPFGDVVPHDSRYNRDRMSLHNYFIYKSLHLVRPGGVVAVLTSRWTMDATNPAAREAFASMADLVTAVRLPGQTHQQAAGTDAITDLLVFRRRGEGEEPFDLVPNWRGVESLPSFRAGPGLEDAEVTLNSVFVQQPARVLGRLTSRMGRFGPEVAVSPPLSAEGQTLAERVAGDLHRELTRSLSSYAKVRPLFTPAAPRPATPTPRRRSTGQGSPVSGASLRRAGGEQPLVLPDRVVRAEGHISANAEGGWQQVCDGVSESLAVPKSQAMELRMLLGLRDTVVTLLEAESTTPLPDEAPGAGTPSHVAEREEQMGTLRARLNRQYDAYMTRYGPINRVTARNTGRIDAKTGEPVVAQVRPRQGGFADDPHSAAVFALEHYDSATGTARKADIFIERVVAPRVVRTHAESPADAVSLCLDTYGELRTNEIARLLEVDEAQAAAELEAIAFVDADTVEHTEAGWRADWVSRAEFLSGNVRARLNRVETVLDRVAEDSTAVREESAQTMLRRLQAAQAALVDVLPEDLGPTEIVAQLGVPWVSAETVEQFLRETLDDRTVEVEHPGGPVWSVRGNRHSVAARNTWGTDRVSAIDIVQACLEQRQIRVTDEMSDGRRIPNETATFAAQEKAEELQERFATWLWEDPERCQALMRRYNDALNAIVLRSYDVDEDKHYPGMARSLRLRPHQHAAVARMVAQPSVLLAHEVGAGKTFSAITGCMELRRLDLVRKPAVVVPNHMLEQFSREWLQAYPQARVLTCGTEDLVKDKRRLFVARAATGEWDAVIMSRSAFEKIPVSKDTEERYLDDQLIQLRIWLAASKDGRGLSVKRLEGTLARAEERLKKLRDVARDPAITFEATGIDYLCVDEAHGYKNLRLASNIPGVAVEGSNRATDLDLKMSYLRGRHGRRVATFMTATPIANSVAEAYTMLRYLAPDDLEAAGISDFDTWAATFGSVITDLELSPSGTGFRMKARFAKFSNVPELLRLWHQVADVKTAEDLHLPIPNLDGGAPETVVVPPSQELVDFMALLAKRADLVSCRAVDPSEDNMLKISGHGRAAALDLRLVDHQIDGLGAFLDREPSKVDAVAERVAAIYHDHADLEFGADPEPGALQLVFCDLGTPTGTGWNAYEELKAQLVSRGVPAGKVRFMHEARNDRAKARLFEQARTGHVAVLIGSTEKMGVGTNVQRRAVALHHVDCPWRPADLAQRDGRILRQGNLNSTVRVYRYVTESSFDTYLWQTVERKAKFINQLMRGRLDVREIEDIGDSALSYAEVKALASGDSRIMELAKAETNATKLERLERAWSAAQRSLAATIREAGPRLERLALDRKQLLAAMPVRCATDADAFSMRINGVTVTKRPDAAPMLQWALRGIEPYQRDPQPLGEVGGLHLQVAADSWLGQPRYVVSLVEVPRVHLLVETSDVREPSLGLVQRVENLPRRLERVLEDVEMDTTKITREAEKAQAGLVDAFPRADELATVRATRDRLAAELAADSTEKTPDAPVAQNVDSAGADGSPPDPSRASGTVSVSLATGPPGRPAIAPPSPGPRPQPYPVSPSASSLSWSR
ncbi:MULTISPECIES: SNF2-related protein [unclassified Nocardioides]|uniref:SNF2-related protein n=1 Tax=unclassified Nocardioides TaxID=2615069 RepID=UPI0009F0CAFB|nr:MULTISPECIES: SNF2-related protein [unclassified Nocardioides]GAW47930.1 helicase domain-containing protein [Nocardioides sp. PD653-B2]GAW53767.1 helicase domain-containing protein [Nocardioides sp. PD653]